MLGKGLPAGTLFKNRRPTEKVIKKIPLDNSDYITSRILRLNGLEEGKNKGGDVDSYNRYIYIHGTPHCNTLGSKQSQGCIRMSDRDVIKLFDLVDQKTKTDLSSTYEITKEMSEKVYVIPPKRVRYLSEIAENNRAYDEQLEDKSS